MTEQNTLHRAAIEPLLHSNSATVVMQKSHYCTLIALLLECKSKRIRDASIYTSKKISLKLLFLSDILFDVYILVLWIRLLWLTYPIFLLFQQERSVVSVYDRVGVGLVESVDEHHFYSAVFFR